MDKLGVFHEHYRDTFSNIREHEKKRDAYLLYASLAMGALFFLKAFPSEMWGVLSILDQNKTDAFKEVPLDILVSALWLSVFVVFHKHLQLAVNIHRQYSYLHAIEKRLSKEACDEVFFQREGKGYNSNYPAFSWWTYLLFVYFLPTLLWLLSARLLWTEVDLILDLDFSSCLNAVLFVAMTVSYSTRTVFQVMSESWFAKLTGDNNN